MPDTFTKLAYQAFQQSKSYFGLVHKALNTQLLNVIAPPVEQLTVPISAELISTIQKRLDRIFEADWQDAEQGVYPVSLLFDNPWEDFFRFYPQVWFDSAATRARANSKSYREFAADIDTQGYPNYYVQNFHHQTDGYLSEHSANLYDLQVEILFNGGADPMRRRVLAPLKRGLETFSEVNSRDIKVLDVASGTGRTLRMLRAMLPKASLYGVDLSPAYLRKANQLLSELPGELPQLVQANAEDLPYRDGYFHGITCVFLFHELPAPVRQKVINECFRVLKPGGTFVICDSIQLSDSPDMEVLMENFPAVFHEPFYRNYIGDDLVARLKDAGFGTIDQEVHFMSKYLIAQKPMDSQPEQSVDSAEFVTV